MFEHELGLIEKVRGKKEYLESASAELESVSAELKSVLEKLKKAEDVSEKCKKALAYMGELDTTESELRKKAKESEDSYDRMNERVKEAYSTMKSFVKIAEPMINSPDVDYSPWNESQVIFVKDSWDELVRLSKTSLGNGPSGIGYYIRQSKLWDSAINTFSLMDTVYKKNKSLLDSSAQKSLEKLFDKVKTIPTVREVKGCASPSSYDVESKLDTTFKFVTDFEKEFEAWKKSQH